MVKNEIEVENEDVDWIKVVEDEDGMELDEDDDNMKLVEDEDKVIIVEEEEEDDDDICEKLEEVKLKLEMAPTRAEEENNDEDGDKVEDEGNVVENMKLDEEIAG